MTDEQIRILLSLGCDEAKLLLDHNEYALYREIQKGMVNVVRDYDVKLPLNCLQFMYHEERLHRPSNGRRETAEVRLSSGN